MTPEAQVLLYKPSKEESLAIAKVEQTVEQALIDTTPEDGTVAVLLENAFITEKEVSDVEYLSNRGIAPSRAYLFGYKIGSPTNIESMARFIQTPSMSSLDTHSLISQLGESEEDETYNLLFRLDRLHEQYRNNEGVSRLQLLFESNASVSSNDEVDEWVEDNARIFTLLEEGNFESALTLFKKRVFIEANNATYRQEGVANKVKNYLEATENAKVIIAFRTAHSGIQHGLQRQNISVQKQFLDKSDKEKFQFDPQTAAIRKVIFKGYDTLSDTEWYQAMLGDFVYTFVRGMNKQLDLNNSDQGMIDFSVSKARSFYSAEDIETFRIKLIETNIVAAIMGKEE